jgi:hypothetical protein
MPATQDAIILSSLIEALTTSSLISMCCLYARECYIIQASSLANFAGKNSIQVREKRITAQLLSIIPFSPLAVMDFRIIT